MLGKSYRYSSPKHGEKRIFFNSLVSFFYSITVRGIIKCLLQEERFSYYKLIIISLFIVWGIKYRIKYHGEHFKFCMSDKIFEQSLTTLFYFCFFPVPCSSDAAARHLQQWRHQCAPTQVNQVIRHPRTTFGAVIVNVNKRSVSADARTFTPNYLRGVDLFNSKRTVEG